jgi:beta-hydroxylase
VRDFPELREVTEQWQMIREEALKLFDEGHIRAAAGYNDIGFNTFFRRPPRCWKKPSINAAMFTLLPPGSRLDAHRDPKP